MSLVVIVEFKLITDRMPVRTCWPHHHLKKPKTLPKKTILVFIAVRSATFGAWRMLTLGAEYSSWARTDTSNRCTRAARHKPDVDDDNLNNSDVGPVEQTFYDSVCELKSLFDDKNVPSIIHAHKTFTEDVISAPWCPRSVAIPLLCLHSVMLFYIGLG